MKRLLSFLLALAMCVGMLPAGVWADPAQNGQTSEPTTEDHGSRGEHAAN